MWYRYVWVARARARNGSCRGRTFFAPPSPPPFHADLFVASESPLGESNVPVFWCLDITRLKPRWAVFAGASGDSISSSSPIVTTTFSGDPVILFGAENTVRD